MDRNNQLAIPEERIWEWEETYKKNSGNIPDRDEKHEIEVKRHGV